MKQRFITSSQIFRLRESLEFRRCTTLVEHVQDNRVFTMKRSTDELFQKDDLHFHKTQTFRAKKALYLEIHVSMGRIRKKDIAALEFYCR